MKKFFLASLALFIFLITNQKLNAQTPALKIGVFDLDLMVRALPEYRNVDSLTSNYEQDTLGAEYQVYQSEYHRLDSTLRADSAKGNVAKSVMDYNNQQKQQITMQLVYWQQIAQNKSDEFRREKSQPLYVKVVAAYKKVLAANKYNLILKPNTYELGGTIHLDNIFPLVAKEMGVTIDPGLTIDLNKGLDSIGGDTTPETGTGKP